MENFQKFKRAEVESYKTKYDVKSIMHYDSKAFSINGLPTLTGKDGRELRTQVRTNVVVIPWVTNDTCRGPDRAELYSN